MISAILATIGICIGIGLVIIGATYAFAKLVLAIVGGAAGCVANAFKKVRK